MAGDSRSLADADVAKASAWPVGGGEMGALARAKDWSRTPLGPVESWPQSLKTALDLALACDFPMRLLWGPELVQLYNDGYRAIMAGEHPGGLGRPARDFSESVCARVRAGETVRSADRLIPVARHGRLEDAWFTLCHSPLRDATGAVAGVIVTAVETAAQVEAASRAGDIRYRRLFEAMDEGFCTIELIFDRNGKPRDYRFLEANPAFLRQTGLKNAIGRTMRELAPAHEQFWFDIYGRIALGGGPERFEHEAAALGRYFEVFAFRIGKPEERRVAVLFNDIADRKRAERLLRVREERQAFRLRFSDALQEQPDEDAVASLALRLLAERLGVERCCTITIPPDGGGAEFTHCFGEPGVARLPKCLRPADFPAPLRQMHRTVVLEDAAGDPELSERDRRSLARLEFGALVAAPAHRDAAAPSWGIVAVSRQPRAWTTEEILLVEALAERTWTAIAQARAECAVARSEEQYRTLFDSITAGFCIFELLYDEAGAPVDYRFLEINPAYYRSTGLADAVGKRIKELMPEHEQRWFDLYGEVAATGESANVEQHNERTGRWFDVHVFRAAGSRRNRIAAVFTDITARKRAEEHRKLLIHELNHRVKNTLATVQSLAAQSLDDAASPAAGRAAFEARLVALAKAHDILTRRHWQYASLEKIVAGAIAPYAAGEDASRFEIQGGEMRLTAPAGLALAMALHELATNAVKYGALADDGRVAIQWHREDGEDGRPRLHLRWAERGGPPVAPPRRRGFGSRLIERGLAQELGGTTKLCFEPSGLACHITAPLERIAAGNR